MPNTVIIVGGGPAGLMLAGDLGRCGVQAIVVEQDAEPRIDAPGMAINTCSVELLEQRGVMQQLRPETLPLPAVHFALIQLDVDAVPDRYADQVIVNQVGLERVLEQRAIELGAEIRRGRRVVGLDQHDAGVTVRLRSGDTEETLDGRYLVGCDGTRSTVRDLVGIDFRYDGDELAFDGLIGEVEVAFPTMPPALFSGATYRPSGGVYIGAPLGPTSMRIITSELVQKSIPVDAPATLDDLREAVSRITDNELPAVQLRWISRWQNIIRQAERYRVGNVFLAGDAAQTIVPYNGQAISNALLDAANLAWKLAATINGWAPDGLLDSYERERRAAARLVCDNIHAQIALSQRQSEVGPLRELFTRIAAVPEVNLSLIEAMTSLDTRYPMGDDGAADVGGLLGRLLPPAELTTGDGATTSTAALLDAGRGVLLDLSEGELPGTVASGWSDRVDVVVARPTAALAAEALLVRPDGHVAWAAGAADAAGLRDALATWFGPARAA